MLLNRFCMGTPNELWRLGNNKHIGILSFLEATQPEEPPKTSICLSTRFYTKPGIALLLGAKCRIVMQPLQGAQIDPQICRRLCAPAGHAAGPQ